MIAASVSVRWWQYICAAEQAEERRCWFVGEKMMWGGGGGNGDDGGSDGDGDGGGGGRGGGGDYKYGNFCCS